jgi:bisphosphoglycerate-independent phosphoglycerate mutase (AlkP superfamily)
VSGEKVSLRDLAPTILSMFGIEKPAYMTGRILPVGAPAWRT